MVKETSPVNLAFILILLCASNVFVCRGEWEPTWSSRAAEEAEAVAAIPCSGHGRAYLDGLILKGHEPVCECNPCYGGSDCSKLLSDCAANIGMVVPQNNINKEIKTKTNCMRKSQSSNLSHYIKKEF